jgi:transcriptional regulator with XRE-family HTH domain
MPEPVTDPPVTDEPATSYQVRLGERLRAVRRAQGMRLQDVEEQSDGRFKAVVVGSYERGDRAVSAHKLAALASFYQVPLVDLLPEEGPVRAVDRAAVIRVAVDRVYDRGHDPEVAPLLRLVQHVQGMRDDRGRVLTLRRDDLRTIAVALGAQPDRIDRWLDERGLLAPES